MFSRSLQSIEGDLVHGKKISQNAVNELLEWALQGWQHFVGCWYSGSKDQSEKRKALPANFLLPRNELASSRLVFIWSLLQKNLSDLHDRFHLMSAISLRSSRESYPHCRSQYFHMITTVVELFWSDRGNYIWKPLFQLFRFAFRGTQAHFYEHLRCYSSVNHFICLWIGSIEMTVNQNRSSDIRFRQLSIFSSRKS